ncbi:MAG: FAD-dependent oxidoreductase [Acidimicrobiales bacterium]
MNRDVAVIGGGVAGLATALALSRAERNCSVFESTAGESRAGMGFLLMENGLTALARLGLADAVHALGTVADEAVVFDRFGRELLRRSFQPHLGMERAALIDLLERTVGPRIINYGKTFERLRYEESAQLRSDREDDRCQARADAALFDDGSTFEADLFIGADGRRSRVRECVCPGHSTGNAVVAELISSLDAPELAAELGTTLLRFRDPDCALGVSMMPTGRGRVVWYITHDREAWDVTDDLAGRRYIAALVADWPHPIPTLLESTDFATSYIWRTADMDPLPYSTRGNVALVGDAAHPLLPFSTQGVNSALVDAVTLADALDDLADGRDSARALSAWSTRRRHVTSAYLEYGRERARVFLDPELRGHDPPFPESVGRRDLQDLAPRACG